MLDPTRRQSDRELFEEQGYLILEGCVDDGIVAGVEEEMSELLRLAHGRHGLEPPDGDVDTLYLSLKEGLPWLKGRCYDLFGLLGGTRAMLHETGIVELARELLSSPIVVDYLQVRVDDASNDRLLPLHQELGQMALSNLTVWAPLTDVIPGRTGGLRFVPGSHRAGFLEHRRFEEPSVYWGVAEQESLADASIEPELRRGDALVFHPLLVHGSTPRLDDGIRWTLVARLNGVADLRYLESSGAERHYPTDRHDPVYQRYNR